MLVCTMMLWVCMLRSYYVLQTSSTHDTPAWILKTLALPAKDELLKVIRFCYIDKQGKIHHKHSLTNGMLVDGYQRIHIPHRIKTAVFICDAKHTKEIGAKISKDASLQGLNLFISESRDLPLLQTILQRKKSIDARIIDVSFPVFDSLIRFSLVAIVSAYILTAIYICLTLQQRKGTVLLPVLLDNRQTREADVSETSSVCAICLDDYNNDVWMRVLSCKHSFHQKCVDQWLLSTCSLCPLCRQSLVL
jgi:hypothetical protein